MANLYWKEEGAQKGRLVTDNSWATWGDYTIDPAEVEKLMRWDSKKSLWANRTKFEKLEEFAKLKNSEITERMGFLAWNEAVTNPTDPAWKTVKIKGKSFYSVCGYRDLLPHLHNYRNTTEAIMRAEKELVQDLIFHLFGVLGHTCLLLPKLGPNATGYTIRFDSLTVTAKDNIASPNPVKPPPPAFPTNRVARGRIFGAVLIPAEIVDGQPEATNTEVFVNPKWVVRTPTVEPEPEPEAELPEDFAEAFAHIPLPVGQFGLSPEKTREEQIKLYGPAQLDPYFDPPGDPDLPIENPAGGYAAKLLKYRSKLIDEDRILESLQGGKISEPVHIKNAGDLDMYFISYLTSIDFNVHKDPEFLLYHREYEATLEAAARSLYHDALQYEVDTPDSDPPIEAGAPLRKLPPPGDILQQIDDIGALRVDEIPDALYAAGKEVSGWIITVGIKKSKLWQAETADWSKNKYPPDSVFGWMPRLGAGPYKVPVWRQVKAKAGYYTWRWYYVHETEYEYENILYDKERMQRERQKAMIKLYETPAPGFPAKEWDYKHCYFDYAKIPFSNKAAIVVAIAEKWVLDQPLKDNAIPSTLPPVAEMPKTRQPMPFRNWRKAVGPHPVWLDSNRNTYYTVVEAEDEEEFKMPTAKSGKRRKPDLKRAELELGFRGFKQIAEFYGKDYIVNPKVDPYEYYLYFLDHEIDTEVWIGHRPTAAPRTIVGIQKDLIDSMPTKSRIPDDEEIESINARFQKSEKLLILRMTLAYGPHSDAFGDKLGIVAKSLKEQAAELGTDERAPNGLTQRQLKRAANRVGNFPSEFDLYVVQQNDIWIDQYSEDAKNHVENGNTCAYFLYLDPEDFSIIDVFFLGHTRLIKGLPEFKTIWQPPQNFSLQFIFWAQQVYLSTHRGRSKTFSDYFFAAMSILKNPIGALGDLLLGIPDIPGLPKGFLGQTVSGEVVAALKKPPTDSRGYTPSQMKKIDEDNRKLRSVVAKRSDQQKMGNHNLEKENPGAAFDDFVGMMYDDIVAGGEAFLGSHVFMSVLGQVNVFNLIMMYLACLGIEMPFIIPCLWNFEFPWINIPWPLFTIPEIPWINWLDILEIIRRIIVAIIIQLIISLILFIIKEIIAFILGLVGCSEGGPALDYPPMPGAPFDFGPFDPERMLEDALEEKGALADGIDLGAGIPQTPEDLANALMAQCGGLSSDDFGKNKSGLNYLKDVAKITTGTEFCSLMHGNPSIECLKVVIDYTKKHYSKVYKKIGAAVPGFPSQLGSHDLYKDFFSCLGQLLAKQVDEVCNPEALIEKYAADLIDNKCELPNDKSSLDEKLKELWKDKGLEPDEIKDLIEKADADLVNKLMDLEALNEKVNDILEVITPKVTAPVVNSIQMRAFDRLFAPIAESFNMAVGSIRDDTFSVNSDIQMMTNFVINAKGFRVQKGGHWHYRRKRKWFTTYYYRDWYHVTYKQGFGSIFYPQKNSPLSKSTGPASDSGIPTCPADPIFVDEKWMQYRQIWPDPSLPQDVQDMIMKFFKMDKPFFKRSFPSELKSLRKKVAYPGYHTWNPSPAIGGFGGKAYTGPRWLPNYTPPRWYREQGTLKLLFEQNDSFAGVLGDVQAEAVQNFKEDISEEIKITNGILTLSTRLNAQGTAFTYDIYKLQKDAFEGFDVWENILPEPVEIPLDTMLTNKDGEPTEPKYPWWHERKITQVSGEDFTEGGFPWIQKAEFVYRFIPDDHPLRTTSKWEEKAESVFMDIHDNFYIPEINKKVIEPIRRSPMESFWLQEYYAAENFSELVEGFPPEETSRALFFDQENPYFRMADIRHRAKDVMKK